MEQPKRTDEARANFESARSNLLAFLAGSDHPDCRRAIDNREGDALWIIAARNAKLHLALLDMAMMESRDIKQAARDYLDGAQKNADAAAKIAGSVRKATWVAALATAGTLFIAILQFFRSSPPATIAPVINVPAPVVNVALPPQPSPEPRQTAPQSPRSPTRDR